LGTIRLVRNNGRIGTNGQELAGIFSSEEAGEALEALARASAGDGIGICDHVLSRTTI